MTMITICNKPLKKTDSTFVVENIPNDLREEFKRCVKERGLVIKRVIPSLMKAFIRVPPMADGTIKLEGIN